MRIFLEIKFWNYMTDRWITNYQITKCVLHLHYDCKPNNSTEANYLVANPYFHLFKVDFLAPGKKRDNYIKILMKQFCAVPLHNSLCKILRVSNSKYEHKQTNSTIGSNLLGPIYLSRIIKTNTPFFLFLREIGLN